MGDSETEDSNPVEITEEEQELEKKIKKEIKKLQFYLGECDDLLDSEDFNEIQLTCKRTDEIQDRLNNLVSSLQELKIELGKTTERAVRQWKKELKSTYAPLLGEKAKLCKALEERERSKTRNAEKEKMAMKFENEEQFRQEVQRQERELWEEKMRAELRTTEKKLELERAAKGARTKLPELKITPFSGTSADWIRFENMFVSQIHKKPISDEEKFGYLLELVTPKVRDRLANLKPSALGYKTAWDRLKTEYGQSKTVIAAHMEEIINLPLVRGSNYDKIRDFYEKLSKNFDALQTLEEGEMLKGFVMCTLTKLPQVKPDITRTDDNWEDWGMQDLLVAIQKWLKRNKIEDAHRDQGEERGRKRERHFFSKRGADSPNPRERPRGPFCIFCEKDHWGDECKTIDSLEKRKRFFVEKKLCFNCGRAGHRENKCRSRGCYKCKAKHHTSLCDKLRTNEQNHNAVLTGYTPVVEERTLPAIIPLKIQGVTLWAYLDTGSGRNFISSDAIEKLNLAPERHESRHIVTVNEMKKQSMPIFNVTLEALDGRTTEKVEVTGSRMADFTTVKRPSLSELKAKFRHAEDKTFYKTANEEYTIHVILGDSTYCKIRTEEVFKGRPEDPIVEGTTFGWVIHGGVDYGHNKCMYVKETSDYEKLYSLDVLGVEDRGENDQLDVYKEFKENVTTDETGRYQVKVPWIPGSVLTNTNEQPSRRRLISVERKLKQNPKLEQEYRRIVEDQLEAGIIEKIPETPTGDRVYYMPHKPVVREDATTTKVRMVFDASAKAHPLASSVNDCMHTGPPLQPLLWDIMIRVRMSTHLILADIQKAFLQISVNKEDRDAFRFLFNINGREEHLRFTRVPFGVESSPFLLGATLQQHYDKQPEEYETTVTALRENTYVDNLMKTASDNEELKTFKREATCILESAKFPVHKWESNVQTLDDKDTTNPSKILGHVWNKREDTLEVLVPHTSDNKLVTKKTILSQLASIYDPLGILSPTVVEGKRIYREACDERDGWNTEVSCHLVKVWLKWTNQLRNVKVPRCIANNTDRIKNIHLHVFADASNVACSAVVIAVVEQETGLVKGLLTSKSRISKRNTSIARLELVSGHMAANMVKNLSSALQRWPIASTTVWMDSMVALYWISSPGKPWKVFVANRVRKIAQITSETSINWMYCPTSQNLADLGSRGATLDKLESGEWFTGPSWLLDERQWPAQPNLKWCKDVEQEHRPVKEDTFYTRERRQDQWEELLARSSYWKTLRVTAWALRFLHNALARRHKKQRTTGPLTTEEIAKARDRWVLRVQSAVSKD